MKKTILLTISIVGLLTFAKAQTSIDNAVQGTGINQHNYVGARWVHGSTTPTFYNSTLSYSNVTNAYVTFTFVGNEIKWYTEKRSTHGIVSVSIDGGASTNVDLYAATDAQRVLVFSSPILNQGNHTLTLRVTGTKNPASTGFYAIHDYVVIAQAPANTNTASGLGAFQNYGVNSTYNSAFGFNALNSVPNGSGNTGIGVGALLNVPVASNNNTAVGYQALPNGGGGNNTAVGTNTLSGGEAGSYNTAVGSGAGQVGSTAFTNSTALGAGAKFTASNQVRIGNTSTSSIGGQVSWSTLSDGRFKRDLKEDVSGLEFLNKLRPVSYMVDKTAFQKFLGIPDSEINNTFAAKEKPTRQTGFVAQEVESVLKKSGYVFSGIDAPKGENDAYTIRYAEFVVPLVKAVQELSAKNDEKQKLILEQRKQIDQLLKQLEKIEGGNIEKDAQEISLVQNNPNPYSANTEIKMVLPETAMQANIIVYNLEGQQLKELPVKGRGKVSATILGGELTAGMYIYALIVDGQVIDTKRMILTK